MFTQHCVCARVPKHTHAHGGHASGLSQKQRAHVDNTCAHADNTCAHASLGAAAIHTAHVVSASITPVEKDQAGVLGRTAWKIGGAGGAVGAGLPGG